MKMLSSFGGDEHEFYLVVMFKHVRSCQRLYISYTWQHRVK